MKAFPLAVILLVLTASLVTAGCTTPEKPEKNLKIAEMERVADNLTVSIDQGLGELRSSLENNSRALTATGLSGRDAETVLNENLRHHPWAISSLIVSKEGMVMTAVPGNSAIVAGMNMSGRPQIDAANRARAPIVSPVFRMAEGFSGISQSYPVFTSSGGYLGFTDITYTPSAFLIRHIENITGGTGYEVWVAQTDGTILCDSHKEEVGTNLFTDPAYADPALQAIFSRIVHEQAGNGSYSFHDDVWNRTITKTAVWDTAGIDGAEWRVVVTDAEGNDGEQGRGTPATPGEATGARYTNLTRYVQDAAAYARAQGRVAAIREFNNPNGQFTHGDLYIFAYDMNGTTLALPYQQGLIGTDRRGISDSNGVAFFDRMIELAQEGGGSVYYIYPNPEDNYREEFKITYIVPVDSGWFIGAGIYLPGLPAGFNTTERDELALRVKEARRYAQLEGADKAIADFNDRKGAFANGSRYIFAYADNGTTLALPFQPDEIGTNRLNYTDPYGVKITAWEISVARRGGGFVYVDYPNPDTGIPGLKLCYVEPVDKTWLVGSGIYTGEV